MLFFRNVIVHPECREVIALPRKNTKSTFEQQWAEVNETLSQLHDSGHYKEGLTLAVQSLAMARQHFGDVHPEIPACLNAVAVFADLAGDRVMAEKYYLEAYTLCEEHFGARYPFYAGILNNLSQIYALKSDYFRAFAFGIRALNHKYEREGFSPSYAISLANIADYYSHLGNAEKAEQSYSDACARLREAGLAHVLDLAQALLSMGDHYHDHGHLGQAKAAYDEAQEAIGHHYGDKHPLYASAIIRQADLAMSLGDDVLASDLYMQGIELQRAELGEKHPSCGATWNNISVLFRRMGKLDKAYICSRRALRIYEALDDKSAYLSALSNMAVIQAELRNYGLALSHCHEATAALDKSGVMDPRLLASILNTMALIYMANKALPEAKKCLETSVNTITKAFGRQNPLCKSILSSLAVFSIASRDFDAALDYFAQAATVEDNILMQCANMSSERQQLTAMTTLILGVYFLASFALKHGHECSGAIHQAFLLAAKRKGCIADVIASRLRKAKFKEPETDAENQLYDLMTVKRQIAQRTVFGPGSEGLQEHMNMLSLLNNAKEKLEGLLAGRGESNEGSCKVASLSVNHMSSIMPPNSAFIEYLRFRVENLDFVPVMPGTKDSFRYVAFVLRGNKSPDLQMVDLGDADAIDHLVQEYRKGISPTLGSHRSVGVPSKKSNIDPAVQTALYNSVVKPIESLIGNSSDLFLAPDGDLLLIPLHVLSSPDNSALIDKHVVTYLTSAKDLLRLDQPLGNSSLPMIIGSPKYERRTKPRSDKKPSISAATSCDRNDLWISNPSIEDIPASKRETSAIVALVPAARVYTGVKATKQLLETAESPSLLHLATHAFCAMNAPLHKYASPAYKPGIDDLATTVMACIQNPLLRSGIIFSAVGKKKSANVVGPDKPNNIMTAEEVSCLNLADTQLVVLSGCDTAMGDTSLNEGLMGLRRSFLIAGARSLIMSMWRIDDEQTADFMTILYRKLVNGEGVSHALRNTALEFRKNYSDPSVWGAFICVGSPSPINLSSSS